MRTNEPRAIHCFIVLEADLVEAVWLALWRQLWLDRNGVITTRSCTVPDLLPDESLLRRGCREALWRLALALTEIRHLSCLKIEIH